MTYNKYPEYAKVEGKRYKINTSYMTAIRCNEIAFDDTIDDYERVLAIIYKLFGKEALENKNHYEKLMGIAFKYLACGKELEKSNEEPDMDFSQDLPYIKTSFRSDYGINLDNEDMHWWEFNDLISGLSNSELGNCCVLNRIRNLRNLDLSEIEDLKRKEKLAKAKESVALKKKQKPLTEQQKQSHDRFMELAGLNKKEE